MNLDENYLMVSCKIGASGGAAFPRVSDGLEWQNVPSNKEQVIH